MKLPEDKYKEIITSCRISLQGYEAAVMLKAFGFKNVRVLEGGMSAWLFVKEK